VYIPHRSSSRAAAEFTVHMAVEHASRVSLLRDRVEQLDDTVEGVRGYVSAYELREYEGQARTARVELDVLEGRHL
jgi:hypothetical protein